MGVTPDLPDGTPHEVNGYTYDPEPYNGNVWFGDVGRVAVHVQPGIGSGATAKVHDERLSWGGMQYLTPTEFIDDVADEQLHESLPADPPAEKPSYEAAVETAVAWMREHDADEWRHPSVDEAVFDTPAGFDLELYQLTDRKADITYRLEDPPGEARVVELELESFTSTHNLTVVRYTEGSGMPERVDVELEASDREAALLELRDVAADVRGAEQRDALPTGQADEAEAMNP